MHSRNIIHSFMYEFIYEFIHEFIYEFIKKHMIQGVPTTTTKKGLKMNSYT